MIQLRNAKRMALVVSVSGTGLVVNVHLPHSSPLPFGTDPSVVLNPPEPPPCGVLG